MNKGKCIAVLTACVVCVTTQYSHAQRGKGFDPPSDPPGAYSDMCCDGGVCEGHYIYSSSPPPPGGVCNSLGLESCSSDADCSDQVLGSCCAEDGICYDFVSDAACDGVWATPGNLCGEPGFCDGSDLELGCCCSKTGPCTEGVTFEDCDGTWFREYDVCANLTPEEASCDADLTIYDATVLGGAEISDADEESEGAQAVPNLDNDDRDEDYDQQDPLGVAGGDDELVQLILSVGQSDPQSIGVGTVVLSSDSFTNGTILLFENNDRTGFIDPSLTNGELQYPVSGPWQKTLWVEPLSPSYLQQEHEFELVYVDSEKLCKDTVALTVIGIEKIEWVSRGNGVELDSGGAISSTTSTTFDDDPNWPQTISSPLAQRVCPGARADASAPAPGAVDDNACQDGPCHIVDVRVTTTVEPVRPLTLYFESFDVDDPSDDKYPVDGSAEGQDEDQAEDNRGDTPAKAGLFVLEDSTPDETAEGLKSQSFDEVTETFQFHVTMHPGDNFRIVGNADRDFLVDLENDDSDPQHQDDEDRQRIVNKYVTGSSTSNREVLEPIYYASDVLTTWRILHIESDAMMPVDREQNKITGYFQRMDPGVTIVKSATSQVASQIPVLVFSSLVDSQGAAIDLGDGSPSPGRFENGWMQAGDPLSAPTVPAVITPLVANTSSQIVAKQDAMITPLSFNATSATGSSTTTGVITNITLVPAQAPTEFHLQLAAVPWPSDWNEYVGGSITMGGSTQAVTIVRIADAFTGTISTTSLHVPFTLHDDDDDTILDAENDPFPDFSIVADVYADAYYLALNDGGTDPSNNKQNIPFVLNVPKLINGDAYIAYWDDLANQDTPQSAERDDYWVAYVGTAFQSYQTVWGGIAGADSDPDIEFPVRAGVSWNNHSQTDVESGGNNSWVFKEIVREQQKLHWGSVSYEPIVVVHELGHQLGLSHLDDNHLMSTRVDPTTIRTFSPQYLDLLRQRVGSPYLEE